MSDLTGLVNAFIAEAIPSVSKLGIEILELEEGRAVSRLPFEGNANHFGAMYAGSLFVAGEVLAGVVMAPSFDFTAAYPLVKNLTINYLHPANSDVQGVAEVSLDMLRQMQADLAATGRAVWEHRVELTDADGVVVATMSGEGQVRTIG